MRARLERDVQGSSRQLGTILSVSDRIHFGVRATEEFMVALSDDLALLDYNGTDHGVGHDRSSADGGEGQSPIHVSCVERHNGWLRAHERATAIISISTMAPKGSALI